MDEHEFPEGDLDVVVFGSLLDQSELGYLFDDLGSRTARIHLDGYERVFDATADRRETVADRSGVLNLHAGDGWCNGLLVSGLSAAEYGNYARRETTYRFMIVDHEDISFYDDDDRELSDEIIVPRDAPSHTDVKPIPSYVKSCLVGARQWGPEFYDDFLRTTKVASGESLAVYLGIE